MGIRFECPNGHRLNVKAFLAGKRGICPDCDARFIVPAVSGGRATPVDSPPVSDDPQVTSYTVAAKYRPTAAPPTPMPGVVPPLAIDQTLPDVWYVRSAAGEQYGPVDADLIRSWAAEGRVPGDSWVWRTGWDQWKTASDALDALTTVADTPAQIEAVALPEVVIDRRSPDDPISVRLNRLKPEVSRRQRARQWSIALGALVLLLTAALVLVLLAQ